MTGTVKVGTDKRCLRLQFPSTVSQKVWGVKQKYKALGLSDTPTNRLIASRIADEAQLDIAFDRLDPTLEKYNHDALEKTLEKARQIQPKIPKLIDLCTQYFESTIKPRIKKSSYLSNYRGWLRLIALAADADIVTDSVKIFETIKQATTPSETRRVLNILHNLLEWCKRQGIVKENTLNPYKLYRQDVPGKTKQKKPKHIIELNLDEDDDFKGYSPQEAECIIEAFSQRGGTPGLYKNLASFIFLTGCRPSEATGLCWRDISNDFTTITFRQALSMVSKEITGLKTERHGKTKRKFPCGKRLQEILKEIHEKDNPQPEDLVFRQRKGNPVDWGSFGHCWAGFRLKNNHIEGVVEMLVKEGKVSTYLKPYAMRHSFITWQLNAGMTPANVAKLVGNSPEVIYKHYVSADKKPQLAFEL